MNSSGMSVNHTAAGAILRYAIAFLFVIVCCGARGQTPPLPKGPVTISVVDVAGDLALTQGAIEAYQAKNPNLVAKGQFHQGARARAAGEAQSHARGRTQ